MGVLRAHLMPFRRGPWAWLALAANAVPVAGVYLLGWSQGLLLLNYWLDGASLLLCLLVAIAPGTVDRMPRRPAAHWQRFPSRALVVVMGLALLGLPYWAALAVLALRLSGPELWRDLCASPSAALGFLGVVAMNAANVALRGYGAMPEGEVRRSLQWEFSLMLLRASALIAVAFFLPRGMVLGLALILSYAEIYPLRALRLAGAPLGEEDVPARG